MLTSITPLGERGRGQRWPLTMAGYVVGSLLGGATSGVVLGAVGSLLPRLPVLLLAGTVLLLAAVLELSPVRVPGGHRQVDEDWLTRYRGWVYGLGYGYQLGLGVVTVVTSALTYAALCLALLTQSAGGGLVVGAVFGLARSLPSLALGRTGSHAQIQAVARRLDQHATAFSRLCAGVAAVLGVSLLAHCAL